MSASLQVDKRGQFKEDGFQKAMALAGSNSATQTTVKQKKKTEQGEDSDIYKLVQILVERCLDPVRFFLTSIFSYNNEHATCTVTETGPVKQTQSTCLDSSSFILKTRLSSGCLFLYLFFQNQGKKRKMAFLAFRKDSVAEPSPDYQ
jgi:hypothetical protein